MQTTSKAYIIGVTQTDEKICAAAGRMSTQEGNCTEIIEKSQDREKNAKLISKVTQSGHTSTLEHAYLNLAFENVSAMVEQFTIEFRLASFTVKSRRYVDFSNMGYYIPDIDGKLKEKYIEHMNYLFNEYQYFLDNGIEKEDARFVLPYCLNSNFFCSVNAREFLHMLHAMLHGRGKNFEEIYNLGLQLKAQAEELLPGVMTDFDNRAPQKDDKIDLSFIKAPESKNKNNDKVELLSYSDNPEKCVAKQALIINSQLATNDIDKLIDDKAVCEKVIENVVSSSRPRPLEAATFTFRLNNVSLPCITHLVRHRMQSIDIPPLTASDRSIFITPKAIENNPELNSRYKAAFDKNNELYNELKSQGISEETLVYFLLCGNTLDVVTTMNARELLLFCKLRTCTRAQWEIREYAIDMLLKLKKVAPAIFKHYGPSCCIGNCPEGKFSCGRMAEMRKLFND